jgi:hypothetical protein
MTVQNEKKYEYNRNPPTRVLQELHHLLQLLLRFLAAPHILEGAHRLFWQLLALILLRGKEGGGKWRGDRGVRGNNLEGVTKQLLTRVLLG